MKVLALIALALSLSALGETRRRAPCTPYLYVEAYNVFEQTFPPGMKLKRVPRVPDAFHYFDYLEYHGTVPLWLDGKTYYLRLQNGKVDRIAKINIERSKGMTPEQRESLWEPVKDIAEELRLLRILRFSQDIRHPYPIGAYEKIDLIPESTFQIHFLPSPRWISGKIYSKPRLVTGQVYYERVERQCPAAERPGAKPDTAAPPTPAPAPVTPAKKG